MRKAQKQRKIQSEIHYKKAMLERFFSVFKESDTLSKEREMRVIKHLDNQRKEILTRVFNGLIINRDAC